MENELALRDKFTQEKEKRLNFAVLDLIFYWKNPLGNHDLVEKLFGCRRLVSFKYLHRKFPLLTK